MSQDRYERDIDKNIETLSTSYDDDSCTTAAEFLAKAGTAALPKLHQILTLAAYQRAESCEPSERLYYVAKALELIGDRQSVPELARHFEELDKLDDRPTGAMLKMAEVIRTIAPQESANFPPRPGFMMAEQAAALPAFREAISRLRQTL